MLEKYGIDMAASGQRPRPIEQFVGQLSMRIRTWVQLPKISRGLRIQELSEREASA